MMYERTLVSDQAPFDRFMEGDNTALNSIQRQGLSIFLNQGKCVNCHHGAEFTGAAISQLQRSDNPGQFELIERMIMGDGQPAIYDNGYYNINVRPTAEDSGVGGTDPFGNPLSFSLQATNGPVVDKVGNDLADPSRFHVDPAVPPQPGERVAVNGAFKTPTLRNIDLTGPYFHNGGQLTLEQVVQFYARGTDFHDPNFHDGDVDVEGVPEINGDRTRVRAVAAFLRSLTDPRVAWEKAPFDHPSLPVPHGASGTNTLIYEDKKLPGAAQSDFLLVPMVGARGRSGPIKPFLDGSLAGANGVATNDGLLRLTPPPAPVVVTP
jgi:cytochrome c peroxidase